MMSSRNPWSVPMVLLRKKTTGEAYRRLNKITISDPYQMPCIEDLLNQVSDVVWLSKLDQGGLYHFFRKFDFFFSLS